MKNHHLELLAAILISAPALAYGAGTTFPTVNATGNGQNQTPITAFQVPNDIPAADLPTPGGNAVSISSAIQSYSSSQDTPTSAAPTCLEPPDSAQYELNQYYWPTVAESIAWWESQPGIPAPGTYAYQVGSTTSHQDQEGWVGSCTPDPQPCSTGPGWVQETWSGGGAPGNGWTGTCQYLPQPSCSALGPGYYGNYTWNSTNYTWTNTCNYSAPPSCQSLGIGYSGSYTWNSSTDTWSNTCVYTPEPACPASGSSTGWVSTYTWVYPSWQGSCTYVPPPSCPVGYTDTYTWTGTAWSGSCTQPPQPACPAGYLGSYTWNSAGYWQDGCYQPPKPTCPSGYQNTYTWQGASGWVGSCVAACPSGQVGTPSTGCTSLCGVEDEEAFCSHASGTQTGAGLCIFYSSTILTSCSAAPYAQNVPGGGYKGSTTDFDSHGPEGEGSSEPANSYFGNPGSYSPGINTTGANGSDAYHYTGPNIPIYTISPNVSWAGGTDFWCASATQKSSGSMTANGSSSIPFCNVIQYQPPPYSITYNGSDHATEQDTYTIQNGSASKSASYSSCTTQSCGRSGCVTRSVACP